MEGSKMTPRTFRKLLGKISLDGSLKCLTGLHIGASKENMEIGALDSPVVRDPISLEPFIPGSSLKGKLRSLLERANHRILPNRQGGTERNPVLRHECDGWEPKKDVYPGAIECPICRIFGATGRDNGANFPSRLKVRDLRLTKRSKKQLSEIETGLLYTEWKFENGIDRITSAANPRNLERVPRGAKFGFSIVYDVEDVETLQTDLENLQLAIRLLHDDALGGHGSRGYGHVRLDFDQIEARKIAHYRGEANQTRAVKAIEEISELVSFFSTSGH